MSLERVHIVMATYNGEKFLREQMDSLLCQTYENITIEVCDDGSTDGTLEMIKEYCEKDTRVSLHKNETNEGYVKNFLKGIRRSDAPYIMLCDQDDIWFSDKVEKTLEYMKKERNSDHKPVLIYTDAINYDSESGQEMGRFHQMSHLNIKKVDTAHLFMENKCIGCTIMVNQEMVSYLEQLPEQIRLHDWWLALIASHFGKIGYLPEPTLFYRQHSDNIVGGARYGSYVKERLSKIESQRLLLEKTYEQGEAFLKCFRKKMSAEQIDIAERFAGMNDVNGFRKRMRMISGGYCKSGIVRNIGLFLLM